MTQSFLVLKPEHQPYYEKLGEERVAAGKYLSAIRYKSHMLPILRAIEDHAHGHQSTARDRIAEIKTMKAES